MNVFYQKQEKFARLHAPSPRLANKEEARYAAIYKVMQTGQTYSLNKTGTYYFIINHRIELNIPTSREYLAVAKISVVKSKQIEPILLHRNEGWCRENDANFSATQKPDYEFRHQLRLTVEDFFRYHHESSKLEEIDSRLNVKWHAKICGADITTWDKKYYWGEFINKEYTDFLTSYKNDNEHLRLDVSLLNFSTTHKHKSKKPVIFFLNAEGKKATYIRIFAPNINQFNKSYTIIFE